MAEGVEYSPSLIRSLESSLKAAFKQPYLRLSAKPQNAGGHFYVRIENQPKTVRIDDETEQGITEIVTQDLRRTPFSFGIVVLFTLSAARKYALQHMSFSVFHDIVGETVPLFRAEWDQVAAADKLSEHAQPHWHFVQSAEQIARIAKLLMRAPGDIGEFSLLEGEEMLPGVADCGRIHFAMASLWEKNEIPPYRKRLFDSGEFPEWFRNLTTYVAGEIAHLMKHKPEGTAVPLRSFVSDAETV